LGAIQNVRNPVASASRLFRPEHTLFSNARGPTAHRQSLCQLSLQAHRSFQRERPLWLRISRQHFPASNPANRESVDGKSGAKEAFHAETNGGLEAITGKEIDGVPLVRERWRIGCVLAERAERRRQRDFVRSGSRQ